MPLIIPDDYQHVIRTLRCFQKLSGHHVTLHHDAATDLDTLTERFQDADALGLTRERTAVTAALLQPGALRAGRPGFAALDVYEQEPLVDPARPLLQLPNVLCTPHLGYVERKGYELYFGQAFDNVLAFAEGRPQPLATPAVLARH